jgi:hypothetical protein
MKQVVKLGGVALVLGCLVGCIQVSTVIKVKPDGSGTIEETVVYVQELKATPEMASPGKGAKEFKLFNEVELKKKVGEMGEGVTYISGKKITTDEGEGYQAIYAFKDVGKLKFNQNPGEKVPGGGPGGPGEKEEFITFQFIKGTPATLIIKMPVAELNEGEKTAPPKVEEGSQDATTMDKMKEIFKDMKASMAVEMQGTIVETNATYREGSKLTLMEVDFDKMLEDEEKFNKFAQAEPETWGEIKKLSKDMAGIKIELNEKVTIRFK